MERINDLDLILSMDDSDEKYKIMFNKYEPLIYKVSRPLKQSLKKYGYEDDDISQVGFMTIYETMKHFDASQNVMYYTYLLKALKNAYYNIIRENESNKKKTLNESISVYKEITNNNLTIMDVIEDKKDNYSLIEEKNEYITLKNILSYNDSCVFEMLINGYKLEEISILLEREFEKVKESYFKIKKQLLYI